MKKDSLEARYEQIIESAQQILGESSDPKKDRIREKILKLKNELKSIIDKKFSEDYFETNDPQTRLFHNRREKEIPREISRLRKNLFIESAQPLLSEKNDEFHNDIEFLKQIVSKLAMIN